MQSLPKVGCENPRQTKPHCILWYGLKSEWCSCTRLTVVSRGQFHPFFQLAFFSFSGRDNDEPMPYDARSLVSRSRLPLHRHGCHKLHCRFVRCVCFCAGRPRILAPMARTGKPSHACGYSCQFRWRDTLRSFISIVCLHISRPLTHSVYFLKKN